MLKISRLADYGTLLMAYIARFPSDLHQAKGLANATSIALPTVSKLLKRLARSGLLESQRGAMGGYALAKSASDISIADIIDAIDGNIAITECSVHEGHCDLEQVCQVSQSWQLISRAIYCALESVTLEHMVQNQISATNIKPIIFNKLGVKEETGEQHV